MELRPIEPGDDARVAHIIRTVMTEQGASGPGFAIHDVEVDEMSAAYARPRRAYFVALVDAVVVGGAGIAPLDGGDDDVCELRKMYVLAEGRGRGLGAALLTRCLDVARGLGYRLCYLETLASMARARELYAAFGFEKLDGPMGDTGHFGCNHWYARAL